jgi:abortive infection bacteriophage resistance protein
VKYGKPALTYQQQADQLLARGLIANRDELVTRLQSVSYYRLSGYWYPFRLPDESFKPGTTFEQVWRRYTFDRRLRLLALDAIERVEVRIRTELVYILAHAQGPFGYSGAANLPNLSADEHAKLLDQIAQECGRSREAFILHFRTTYGGDHPYPPYWMVTELMTFGMLLTLFRGAPTATKQEVGSHFGVADVVMESWLRALNAIRNTCAHHGRLWNRQLGYRPMIPRKDKRWHRPVEVSGDRMFGIWTILRYLLSQIAPQSRWPVRLQELYEEYPDVPLPSMGYPAGWERCPIWTR